MNNLCHIDAMKWIIRSLLFLASLGFLGAMAGVFLLIAIIYKYGQALPDFEQLKDYKPPVVTRVHAGDGRFLAEFAQEKRIFVPINEMPPLIKQAFIAAEDQDFYHHKGVDLKAIARASLTNFKNRALGRRPVGASTITQQVAKNFLLTNEVSYERKIREAILAYRMEKILSKDRLLELYLNQIFLGARAYGVAAAGLHYFNKPLNQLSIAEIAYLAALPKAPNNYHPTRRHDAAVERRNWVIGRMEEEGYITASQAELAVATALQTVSRDESDVVNAPYFAEEVRREIANKYGSDALYGGGLSVRTSVDPALQAVAETALQNGLMAYDRRHGWRGPVAHDQSTAEWAAILNNLAPQAGQLENWDTAMVLNSNAGRVDIGLIDGSRATLHEDDVTWTKSDPLRSGDIIFVEQEKTSTEQDSKKSDIVYRLRQVPAVQGGLVAIDPHTGRVLAMQGGWKFDGSEFNRVTQAKRQPGSAFKPFIYLAALDKGYTPSSIIVDGPIEFVDRAGNVWKPENYSGEYYGPTPLRVGVEKSRNLMTIRLTQNIGIETVVDYARKFGINDNMAPHLANALGSTETTLLNLTSAYGMIVNGGKKITPSFLDRVQDRYGKTINKIDMRSCNGCGPLIRWESQPTPDVPDNREQINDPRTAYQMVSILEGVVQRGTAKKLAALDRPLAGKTGTTNDSKDAWFIGFTPDLVIGVFIGFDEPKSLGDKETGGSTAVPVFYEFIEKALKDTPPAPFRIPPGVRMVQVNAHSGTPTYPEDPDALWEAYLSGTEPNNTTDNSAIASDVQGAQESDIYTMEENFSPEQVPLVNPDSQPAPNPNTNPSTDTGTDTGTGSGTGGIY